MNRRIVRMGIAMVFVTVAATTPPARAEDPCRANCDEWVAGCKRFCDDSPSPDECRETCMVGDRQCLADCD